MIGSRSPRAASQRGISMIVVIVLTLLTIVLSVTALLVYANAQEKEKIAKALEEREKELNGEQARIKTAKDRSLAPTGFSVAVTATPEAGSEAAATEGSSDLPVSEAKKYLEKKRKQYFAEASEGDKKEIGDANLYNTLQDLVVLAAGRVVQAMNKADQRKLDLDLAEDRKGTRVENKGKMATRKTEYTSELEGRISDISAAKTASETHSKDRVDKLQADINAAEEKIKAMQIEYAKMEMDFANHIHKLQGELDELKVKEIIRLEISHAHGRILNPDIPNKIAFIDIGSRERVVAGVKFLVAKRGAQGKFHYKGKILVKKVWMTYAECAITDVYDRDMPIVDGDLIVNPLFHPQRPVVVHFMGEKEPKKLRPAWTVNEATRRVLEIGSEVRDKMTLDVDFVIYTEPPPNTSRDQHDAYQRAVLLGIPVEEAAELFKFLED